jgi:hypothetical protein
MLSVPNAVGGGVGTNLVVRLSCSVGLAGAVLEAEC